jgi:hypothetical protein
LFDAALRGVVLAEELKLGELVAPDKRVTIVTRVGLAEAVTLAEEVWVV